MSLDKLPRPVLVWVCGLALAIIAVVASNAYANSVETRDLARETKIRVDYFEKRLDVFDNKIDKIADRLGVKP